jgi:short-subunit dehydrogenase involved in D-alanine esterification of teichoic acids
MKLTGRTILITGGSAGIGLAFALKFVELGNEVIVTGRRQELLDDVRAKHPKLHTIQSDVADPAQVVALAKQVKAAFPKLDVLMNNAGIMLHKNLKVPSTDLEGLMAEVNINVAGAIRMNSAFINILRANKGTIINVSSASHSFLYRLLRSTAPPKRRFTPTPSRSGFNWRRLAWKSSSSYRQQSKRTCRQTLRTATASL